MRADAHSSHLGSVCPSFDLGDWSPRLEISKSIIISRCRTNDTHITQFWRKEMFYLTTDSTLFIYGYMASDIWLRTTQIAREETRCRHIGYSFQLAARVLLYASFHRQDNTYHGLCYASRGALAGTRNSSMGPPHEGSIRRPIAPWANALTTELYLAPHNFEWSIIAERN